MNAQNEVTLSFVESFESYVTDSKAMGELKSRLEDARKVLEPVIRAHKIPLEPKAENNRVWKEKREIFLPLVERLECPINEDGSLVTFHPTEDGNREKKRMDARVAAWLGVIRTCLEYQILPTDKNADRLRKARTWTALSGNGKPNPNWVDPNAPKIEDKPAETAPVQTDSAPISQKIEAMQANVDAVFGTTSPTIQTQTITQPKTPSKAASISPATPQKPSEPVHPISSNVSSTDEPISAREHCGILLDQLFKNEAFRGEFAPILAMCLDSDLATLTRCLVEARDAMLNGKGVK